MHEVGHAFQSALKGNEEKIHPVVKFDVEEKVENYGVYVERYIDAIRSSKMPASLD